MSALSGGFERVNRDFTGPKPAHDSRRCFIGFTACTAKTQQKCLAGCSGAGGKRRTVFIVHNKQTNTSLYECESCARSVQEITAALATGADIGASLIGDERKRTVYEELRQALTETSGASAAGARSTPDLLEATATKEATRGEEVQSEVSSKQATAKAVRGNTEPWGKTHNDFLVASHPQMAAEKLAVVQKVLSSSRVVNSRLQKQIGALRPKVQLAADLGAVAEAQAIMRAASVGHVFHNLSEAIVSGKLPLDSVIVGTNK